MNLSTTKMYSVHRKIRKLPAGWEPEPERKVAGPLPLKEAEAEMWRLHDQVQRRLGLEPGDNCPYEFVVVPAI